jgi:glycosyltransferase involved in cell wall biosynthesis
VTTVCGNIREQNSFLKFLGFFFLKLLFASVIHMSGSKLVSVVIPTYNSGAYLTETLDSVVRQTYPHREVIIVDDGSTDDTPERVQRFDTTVIYIRQANAGVGAARNTGLRVASGDYLAFLDADDLWLPDKLAVQLAVAARHPDSGLIACSGVYFDGDKILSPHLLLGPTAGLLASVPEGTITMRHPYRELLQNHGIVFCPAQTLIPRQIAERIGPNETARDLVSPDYDYYVRIAREFPITLHRHPLVRYRYRPSSLQGPGERRYLSTIRSQLQILQKEKYRCRPEDSDFVQGLLRKAARQALSASLDYASRYDAAYARAYMAQLVHMLPREPYLIAALLALHCPSTILDGARWLRRAGRKAA